MRILILSKTISKIKKLSETKSIFFSNFTYAVLISAWSVQKQKITP